MQLHPLCETSIELLGSIDVVARNGRLLQVREFQYRLRQQTKQGERWFPGARFWKTSEGEKVKVVDLTMFEVIATGEILFSLG